jgi:hypothetical protein
VSLRPNNYRVKVLTNGQSMISFAFALPVPAVNKITMVRLGGIREMNMPMLLLQSSNNCKPDGLCTIRGRYLDYLNMFSIPGFYNVCNTSGNSGTTSTEDFETIVDKKTVIIK